MSFCRTLFMPPSMHGWNAQCAASYSVVVILGQIFGAENVARGKARFGNSIKDDRTGHTLKFERLEEIGNSDVIRQNTIIGMT